MGKASKTSGMPIDRLERRARFTVIDNRTLEDERISCRAKGVLAYLLSKSDSWVPQVNDIVKHCKEGRDAIRIALRELEQFGYAKLESIRDQKGQIIGTVWRIRECPPNHLEPDNPATGFPHSTDHLEPEIPPLVKTKDSRIEIEPMVMHKALGSMAAAERVAGLEVEKVEPVQDSEQIWRQEFIALWWVAYREHFDAAYSVRPESEGWALHILFLLGENPASVIALAKLAWVNATTYTRHCKHSATLTEFTQHLSGIRLELKMKDTNERKNGKTNWRGNQRLEGVTRGPTDYAALARKKNMV